MKSMLGRMKYLVRQMNEHPKKNHHDQAGDEM